MRTSLRLYTCVALVAVTLLITAIAVQAQSGRSTVSGVVADETPQDRESLLPLLAPRWSCTGKRARANSRPLPTTKVCIVLEEFHTATIT